MDILTEWVIFLMHIIIIIIIIIYAGEKQV